MRRTMIALLSLALVMTVAVPAISQGGVDRNGPKAIDQPADKGPKSRTVPVKGTTADNVLDVSEQLLYRMPEDSYLIPPAEARRLMREGDVVMLDVRERAAFEAGHIPGAVNISLRELTQALNKFSSDKRTTIIVYCGNGDRGGMALTFLRLWGYTNVFSIVDGMNGWSAAGLPLETPDPGWLDPKRVIVRLQ